MCGALHGTFTLHDFMAWWLVKLYLLQWKR